MSTISNLVRDAVAASIELLRPEVDRDWSVPAGLLTWSCQDTAAHVGNDLLKYAGQLIGQPEHGYLRFRVSMADDATPSDVLDVVAMAGATLAMAIEASAPSVRAWHYGATDASGFAAMGIGETLLHTYDVAAGLDLAWRPPPELCSPSPPEHLARARSSTPTAGVKPDLLCEDTGPP